MDAPRLEESSLGVSQNQQNQQKKRYAKPSISKWGTVTDLTGLLGILDGGGLGGHGGSH